MREAWYCALLLGLAAPSYACSMPVDGDVGLQTAPIIYGEDGREELFEVSDEAIRRRVESSVVAFIPHEWLEAEGELVRLTAPPRAQRAPICPDERFADQPAAALCSGVLVDWDLVLTASHCARGLRLDGTSIVFGYHYREAPGALALAPDDIYEATELVAERLERRDGQANLDYAFVRLDRAVAPPRAPAPIRTSPRGIVSGAPLLAAGASDGLPLKIDRGGVIRDARSSELDFFVADTDTALGGSGGAAFDTELTLLGTLIRGGEDEADASGCLRANRVDGADGAEAYAYTQRALADLCATAPEASTLCRADCGDPCQAVAQEQAAGCAAAPPGPPRAPARSTWFAAASMLVLYALRRRQQRAIRKPELARRHR